MADVVNLRLVRKQKARTDKERIAEQNRVLHGRSKVESARDKQISQKADRFVEGHRRARLPDDESDQ